jgi:hypothetical protein
MVGSQLLVRRLELAVRRFELLALGLKLLVRRSERFVLGPELVVLCLKPAVCGLELVVGGLELFVPGIRLEALGFGIELFEVRLRNLFRSRIGRIRRKFRWGRYQECVIALLAADMLADVDASDPQGGLTAWAIDDDPIALGWKLDRARRLKFVGAGCDRLSRGELVVASLAVDPLTEELTRDPQGGRTIGTNRDELGRGFVHGMSSPEHQNQPESSP